MCVYVCVCWGRSEKESESVAPSESAEGQWAEIRLLVSGFSLNVWRESHWAGTVADKGTIVLMESSLLSYQSARVRGFVCVRVPMSLCTCVKIDLVLRALADGSLS